MEAKERTKEVTEVTFVPQAGLLPGSSFVLRAPHQATPALSPLPSLPFG